MMKNIFTKRNLKIAGIILAGVFAAFVVIVLILDQVYQYTQKRDQRKFIEELQRPYLEDTYGGKTQEETFAMFLEALKKEDIDLASKYFIVEKQEKWKDDLNNIQKNGHLDDMINDLQGVKEQKYFDANKVQFVIRTESGQLGAQITLVKYPTGIWKLTEL